MDQGTHEMGRWPRGRTWAAVSALLACLALGLWYLAVHHGLGVGVAIRVLLGCYVLGVAPGYLVGAYVFRLRGRSPFETIVSSFVLGMLVSPPIWYVLNCIGLGAVFFPLAWGAGIVVALIGLRSWRRRRVAGVASCPLWSELLLIGLVSCSSVLWTYSQRIVEFDNGRGVIRAYRDHAYHAARVGELARGVPAERVPFVVGPHRRAYHYMPDVSCDLIRRFCGADVLGSYFHVALPLRYVLMGLACYLALTRRFGPWSAVVGVGCLLGVVGFRWGHILSNADLLIYLNSSFTAPFGLAIVFVILYYLSGGGRFGRGHWLLVSMLSAMLLWYKANFALPVLPSVALVVGWQLYRRGDYRWLAVCWGAQALLVGVHQWELAGADAGFGMALSPFAFLTWWWRVLGLPEAVDAGVRGVVDALPAVVHGPVVLAICVLYWFHVTIGCLAILLWRFGFCRRGSGRRGYDAFVVATVLACVAGFVLFPIGVDRITGRDISWDVSSHLFCLLWTLGMALLGPVVVGALRVLWRAQLGVRACVAIVLVLLIVPDATRLRRLALWETRVCEGTISRARYDAFRHVAHATEPSSVVLHPWVEHTTALASMLTQRRMVLDGYGTWQGSYDAAPVIRDVAALYDAATVEEVAEILTRLGADYVMVDRGRSWRPPPGAGLQETYRNEEVLIYHVSDERMIAHLDDRTETANRGDAAVAPRRCAADG